MDQIVIREALARIRYAPNPLSELALSTMIVRYPQRHPFHATWHADTAQGRAKVGEERIGALMNESKWVLDVLMRHPVRRGGTFAQELKALADVDAWVFRRDCEVIWGTPPPFLGRRDAAIKASVLQIVQEYWDECFASYWPAFKRVLDADVTYRAQLLADRGPVETLASVLPWCIVQGGDVVVPLRLRAGWGYEASAEHRGVTLLPTLVKWGTNVPNIADTDLVISYRARGRGRLADTSADAVPGLVGVLGRTRTELLISLDEPASSTAIALFLGVTTTAVNQHLRALAKARLLQSSRFGRYVLYERTSLADELIAAN